MGILADSCSPVNRDFLLPSIDFAPGNAVYEILAYFMFSYGTGMILLANPNSHFSPQKPINIIGDAGLKTQDAEDSFSSAIQCLESCVLSLVSD